MADPDLDTLARSAAQGDRAALEQLCRELQHPIYRLALRFFGTPEDAQDLTQEILVRVVTNLGSFEGRSKLMTWVYTIATRQLLRSRRRQIESSVRGAEAFAQVLDQLRADRDYTAEEAELNLLCAEVRISCTYGMLLCLSRELRMAYLLGDLLEMTDVDGAEILGITPAAFRQRLARARRTMRFIIGNRCGLVSAANPCRCSRLVAGSIEMGILDPERPQFARHARNRDVPIETGTLDRAATQLDLAEGIAEIYRSDPEWLAPQEVWEGLRRACPDLIG
jgi:RNA polymerase sigma factor (sigma-70 family)